MADCIAAISTPMASGGVSMIRISGADALKVAAKVFIPKYPVRDIEKMDGYTAAYGDITADGTKLDDGVLLIFRAPHSYTGENTAEITCHGGIHVTKRVLQAVLSAGAVMAQAGEFTKQALVNGKLSLTEAEGVIDLINAGNDQLLSCARAQTDGAIGDLIADTLYPFKLLPCRCGIHSFYTVKGNLAAAQFFYCVNYVPCSEACSQRC